MTKRKYISQEFNVSKPIPKDLNPCCIGKFMSGLSEIIENSLGVRFYGGCELSPRGFGLIVRKPNEIKKLPQGLNAFGNDEQRVYAALDKNKEYCVSEIVNILNPKSETPMMSHEGEIYELVKVLYGNVNYIEDTKDTRGILSENYHAGQIFISVCTVLGVRIPSGFYHQLKNQTEKLSLMHVITIAKKSLAMKNGKVLKYGFNRPSNSYKPTK